jgi:aminoglycoside phosphotransferase (APT) family kinase protein/SAM-dependent methyltransferase
MSAGDCSPLQGGDLDRALEALDAGAEFKATLEGLLLRLPAERGERLMLCMREGRGAYLPLLSTRSGRALFCGNALSGTAAALGRCDLELTVVDDSPERLRFAEHRDRQWCFGKTRFVRLEGERLPFEDGGFDLVVSEPAVAPFGDGREVAAPELLRVGRGEWVRHAENRLAYKRSTGKRGEFAKASLGGFLRGVRADREQPIGARGFTSRLEREARARAPRPTWTSYALYPHQNDFSHVVACDGAGPSLTVGPKERQNRAKLVAQRAGLFPWLAPSLLAVGRATTAGTRLDGLLETVAGELGVPTPRPAVLVATRGNTAVVHTETGAPSANGRWTLHLPLSAHQTTQARQHFARLQQLRRTHPGCPVPEPLWEGEWCGAYACAERRLEGWTAPQLTGNLEAAERTYATVSTALAQLAVGDPQTLDDATLDELFTAVYHSDLRAKHVQVTPEGDLLGLLDWGSSRDADLPYFDLLNLIVHDRKQQAGRSLGWAWGLAVDGNLRDYERRALAAYADTLGLSRSYCGAIETLYPALVGAMAESNWDYSRPRWLARTLDRLQGS